MKEGKFEHIIKLIDFYITFVEMDLGKTTDKTLPRELDAVVGTELGFFEDNHLFSVEMNVKFNGEEERFKLNVKSVAIFETSEEITEDFKNSRFLSENSPAIAFPFVRSFINTLTTNAGLKPIIIPSVNFSEK